MRAGNALIVVIAFLSSVGIATAKELRSADVYAAGHPTVMAVDYLGKLLDQRTAGRHKITSLGEDSKNSEVFAIAAMRNGTLDMARVNLASLSNLVPAAIVLALPYIFKSTAHTRRVLDGPIGD